MRVLVACEYSGRVRDAFAAIGHDAWSNDILEASGKHIHGDCFEAISRGWDLIIAHPPCTALAVSGNRWYGSGCMYHHERQAAIEWTSDLWSHMKRNSSACCLENPVGVLRLDVDPVYVQPWMFGHPEQKKTGLWLHNLPRLVPTNDVRVAMLSLPAKQRQRIWHMAPSEDRGLQRSLTYLGMAQAMAVQWGLTDVVPVSGGAA